jgi:hypothetical protein
MKFTAPFSAAEYDIPRDWLEAAGVLNYSPSTAAYNFTPVPGAIDTLLVTIDVVKPPSRNIYHYGLDMVRMIRVLSGFRMNQPIPAVSVVRGTTGYFLDVHDGFHRYVASVYCGFSQLPVSIVEVVELAEYPCGD